MSTFETLVRTTRTVIADTNIVINIKALFDAIPITEYTIPEKKKGRKKKDTVQSQSVPSSGSIVSVKFEGRVRGVELKKGKSAFKNSITIVMVIKDRWVNFKLSKNGRFQITGNNDDYHIEKCVKYMWKIIRQLPEMYTVNGTSVKVTFWSSMENFKTNIGFRIDRQKLNTLVNDATEYISVFETSSGSASVNIKMPLEFSELALNTLTFRSNKWVRGTTMYTDFVSKATGKVASNDRRFVSFLVFHTGEVIMTSMCKAVMKPYFDEFIAIVTSNRNLII